MYPLLIFVTIYSIIEFIYLSITNLLYKNHFSKIQNINIDNVKFKMIPYGVLAYIALFAVVWFFVVKDIFTQNNLKISDIITKATTLAIAIYGIYNLTNAATLNNYSKQIIIQDTIWGIVAINIVALTCYAIKIKFL